MTKQEILTAALEARQQEVMHYQINIDNYTLALEEMSKLPQPEQDALRSFSDNLSNLLKSEKTEQKKASIMLAVIQQQLE
jgi:hypothetical protein